MDVLYETDGVQVPTKLVFCKNCIYHRPTKNSVSQEHRFDKCAHNPERNPITGDFNGSECREYCSHKNKNCNCGHFKAKPVKPIKIGMISKLRNILTKEY